MYDIASTLESYTISDYDIAIEGIGSNIIRVLLAFIKSFKGKLLAIVSAIVALIAAAKKSGGNNPSSPKNEDDSTPETEAEPPKKSTGYNYKRRPNATIARNTPSIPTNENVEEPPKKSTGYNYKRRSNANVIARGSREEVRTAAKNNKLAQKLTNIFNSILHYISSSEAAVQESLSIMTIVEGSSAIAKRMMADRQDDSLKENSVRIIRNLDKIDDLFTEYKNQGFDKNNIKLSPNTNFVIRLTKIKDRLQSIIKKLEEMTNLYTSDKRFETDEKNIIKVKQFIQNIPRNASELITYITQTISMVKAHL